jgi:outer membrane protein OmpA-like peptidoglycan-associated protein
MNSRLVALLTIPSLIPAMALAQGVQRSAAIASSDVLSQISMFNYEEGPKSELLLRATPIAGASEGKIEVEFEDGNAEIAVNVSDLPPPPTIGPYTTYVLWALTPDGRAANQGALGTVEGGDGELRTRASGSQFALIITAEPHYAVSAPSTMIALYNVADDVKGTETKVRSLTERADYTSLTPVAVVERTRPVEVVQAQYAISIATAAGAEQYANTQLATAKEKLAAAEAATAERRSSDREKALPLAREAVIAGEDARRAAMLAKAEADVAAERTAAAAAAAATAARAAAAEEQVRSREAARQDLLNRLNAVLPTRETDRGLVSEIGGVQFATGTADLSSAARESLARFAGIVASYPDLRFKVEGHTDSTGTVEANNELSLRRAISVRDYLISQGVAASSTDVEGLGPARPIADNETTEGRARNRRVEIVITGGTQ